MVTLTLGRYYFSFFPLLLFIKCPLNVKMSGWSTELLGREGLGPALQEPTDDAAALCVSGLFLWTWDIHSVVLVALDGLIILLSWVTTMDE